MASRKEEKERLRQEREAREREAASGERRRRLIGYGVGGGLALAAINFFRFASARALASASRCAVSSPVNISSAPMRSSGCAVALRSSSLWFHNTTDERQISLEGSAVDAKFASDGKRLVYKVVI